MKQNLRAYRRLSLFKSWICQPNQNQKNFKGYSGCLEERYDYMFHSEKCVLVNITQPSQKHHLTVFFLRKKSLSREMKNENTDE